MSRIKTTETNHKAGNGSERLAEKKQTPILTQDCSVGTIHQPLANVINGALSNSAVASKPEARLIIIRLEGPKGQ